MRDLNGTVVAITGASSGIGEATARALAAEGASVVLGARRKDRLTELADELGSRVAIVEMDVRSPEDSQRLVDQAVESFGHLDAIVVNAGVGMYGGIMDQTDDEIRCRGVERCLLVRRG